MTEQDQTPGDHAWDKDEDTEGHSHRRADKADTTRDDDTERHVHRGSEDDTEDDDTKGHEHYR